MIPQLKKFIPELPDKFWKSVREEVDQTQISDMVIPVYQKYSTENDIQERNKFYNTEAGKKLIIVQPEILQEAMAIGQQWGQNIARDIITKYKKQSNRQLN